MRNGKSKRSREFSDPIVMRGSIEAQLRDSRSGRTVEHRFYNNTVVTAGRAWVLSRIMSGGDTTNTISYIAVGTSVTAPTTSDTTLGSEYYRAAVGTFSATNLSSNPPSWIAETSYNTNVANTTLGETGLFNSSSGGTMLAHATFSTINKTTSNTLQINYTISN